MKNSETKKTAPAWMNAPAPKNAAPAVQIPYGMTGKPAHNTAPVQIPVNVYHSKLLPIGETAAAIMYNQAVMIAFVAVDTLYARQKLPVLYKLRNDISAISRLNGIDARLDAQHAVRTMTRNIKHKYRVVKLASGKRFRMECRPYSTKELTEYGKAHIAKSGYEMSIRANLDGEDIVQTAAARFMELYAAGLIQSFSDFSAVTRLVYRAVNRYIMKQRTVQAKETDKVQEDRRLYVIETGIENADTKRAVIDAIAANVHHNVDKKQLARIASLLIDGYTQADICDMLNIGKMSVSRAVATITKAAAANVDIIADIMTGGFPAEKPAPVVLVDTKPARKPAPVVAWSTEYETPVTMPAEKPAAVTAQAARAVAVKYAVIGRVYGSYNVFTIGEYTSRAAADKAAQAARAAANVAVWIERKIS